MEDTMSHDAPAYGLWVLVTINSLVFILFAFSFTHPRTGRDWRSFGAFSAFIVSLFAEIVLVSSHLLSSVWLANQSVSRAGSVRPQFRPFVAYAPGSEGRSPFRCISHCEQHPHIWRIHPTLCFVACPV